MAIRSAIIALALGTIPAAANAVAFFNISSGTSVAIPSNNDFKANLNGLGLFKYSDIRNISLVGTGRVTFEFLGAESGYNNSFKIGSQIFYTESANANRFVNPNGPILFHTGIYNASTFKPSFFTASPLGAGQPGNGNGFGIFSPTSIGNTTVGNNGFTATTIYFGFDDRTSHPDKDFDDIIVRATVSAVPEPAIWGSMILGFGVIGGALRRRGTRTARGGLAPA